MSKKGKKVEKKNKKSDKGRIFVRVMAGILAILMLAGTIITLVYALMG